MKKSILTVLFTILFALGCFAQSSDKRPARTDVETEELVVSINPMDPQRMERITSFADMMHDDGASRGVMGDIFAAAGYSGVSTMIDIAAYEIVTLAKYRSVQKKKWMAMIQNECNYTDSTSTIKGLKDFYQETSTYGALDPSNINFDGISISSSRNGKEFLHIAFHIDTTRLDNLFQHSKFNLVVDTIMFDPYACHLPNLRSNNIRKSTGKNITRDNSFSFDERNHLKVGVDMTLTSSWINEAVQVFKNVELGTFKMTVNIPDTGMPYYYSRAEIDRNIEIMKTNPSANLDTHYVQVEGDSFIVPRSYMPLSGNERMWGTGEYNIKVRLRESCQFDQDPNKNQKMRHWYRDYRQLRRMQGKKSVAAEQIETIWNQNGEGLVKTMIKQGLNTAAKEAGLTGKK